MPAVFRGYGRLDVVAENGQAASDSGHESGHVDEPTAAPGRPPARLKSLAPVAPLRPSLHKSSLRAGRAGWYSLVTSLGTAGAPDQATMQSRGAVRERRTFYALDLEVAAGASVLAIGIAQQDKIAKGGWGRIKDARLDLEELTAGLSANSDDQELLALLLGCMGPNSAAATRVYVHPTVEASILRRLAATGRLVLLDRGAVYEGDQTPPALTWDDGEPFQVVFQVVKAPGTRSQSDWLIEMAFERPSDGTHIGMSSLSMILDSGIVLHSNKVLTRWTKPGPAGESWMQRLRSMGPIPLAEKDVDMFMKAFRGAVGMPPLRLAAEFPWSLEVVQPRRALMIERPLPVNGTGKLPMIVGRALFGYGDDATDGSPGHGAVFVDERAKKLVARDDAAERAARARLAGLAAFSGPVQPGDEPSYWFDPVALPDVVRSLGADGWYVLAGATELVTAGDPQIEVSGATGIDWFDVRAGVSFGDTQVSLPDVLKALRRGEQFITLGDGSTGLIPEDWLARFAVLDRLGEAAGAGWRFAGTQAVILDTLLAAEPAVQVDEVFETARTRLRGFQGVAPMSAPKGFKGKLRPYQRAGFAWLKFLADVGLGGCLADDMGLGKTIQILALLQLRRAEKGSRPSLVVVPKSLVHNWVEEAATFTPSLTVEVYAGPDREACLRKDGPADIVVMTYNMMRMDIMRLREVEFDYVILDEAQHIKNAQAQTAKAARLLKAAHRLALSGTPVENHIRELGSLFEFLNPGMLGGVMAPIRGKDQELTEQAVKALGSALRPLILRRTKEEVLPDLPPKTEQTLYCEFDAAEADAYDELRRFYQQALKDKVAKVGMAKSKIVVLEALLRLRQAACHPGLIDKSKGQAPSAKIDLLMEQLTEVTAGGHKALVFSQFTELLAIVKHRLEEAGLVYEYLDGKTKDRKERVHRFQNDPKCVVFLISLKAGGVGLNLTAADYCYILDPWWNPAAEAQAVDRAHRIGQTRRVFAYRLITQGTVEEKIVGLQQKKKKMADAILQADSGFLESMTASDLEALLAP